MNNKAKVKNNLIYSLLSKFVIIAIGLVLPKITMENYGSAVNGLLNSAHQMVTYLTLFEAGIQSVAVKALYKPIYENDRKGINGILSAVNIQYKKTGMLYLIGLLLISMVYALFIQGEDVDFFTACLLVFFSGAGKVVLFFFQGKYKILLQAEGKSYIDANLQTVISLLTGIVKIILLYQGVNVLFVTIASFVVSLIQAGYILYLIRKEYKWIDLKAIPDKSALEQRNAATIHQISALVFQNTDVLLLTAFCSLETVSVYSLYKLVVTYLSSILYTVYESFNFSLGQLFYSDRNRFTKMLDSVEAYYTAFVFAIYTVAFILFQPFIALYTRNVTDISYTDLYLPLMFVLIELMSVCRLPMLNTINYAGHFKQTTSRTIIETVINLTLSLTLVPRLGIHGVLIGTIAALTFRNTDMILYANKRIIGRKPWKTWGTHLINIVIFTAVAVILQFVKIEVGSYFVFAGMGCIYALLFLGVYIGIQSIFHKNEMKNILKLLRKRDHRSTGP